MDYSSISQDDPAGSSPWQTSPGPERSTFQAAASPPDSPKVNREAEHQSAHMTSSPTGKENREDDSRGPVLGSDVDDGYGDISYNASIPSHRSIGQSISDIRIQGPPMTEEELRQEEIKQQRAQERHQQILHARQQQRGISTSKQQAGNKLPARYRLLATITLIEREGKRDPAIIFDVHTNLPKFRTSQVRNVKRTHGEFIKLAEHLISANPEALVPAVPPSVTSAGAGTDEDEVRTKNAMQRWLNCVCGNDILMRDDEMVFFVESDAGYSPMMRMKQPATGVRRKVIKQFAPPPDDSPELQNARPVVKAFYLGTMDSSQKLDRLIKARRSLGLAESDLGVKFGQLHVSETHPGLSVAYRKLGKIIQVTGDFHAAQGTAEATTLGDALDYHSSDAFVVKETLTNRHIILRDLLSAQQATRSKKAAADRVRAASSVRPEKADEAISHLDEAKSHEDYLDQKAQRVTRNLLQEKRRWFKSTAAELRSNIREYVLREIDAERRALAMLESIRPDIRGIDSSGGLSRLGRESHPHPSTRRASMQASQGPRGDAWSGIPRREGALERNIPGLPTSDKLDQVDGSGPEGKDDNEGSRGRGLSSSGSGKLPGIQEDDQDQDRVDARNAASRLANSTF